MILCLGCTPTDKEQVYERWTSSDPLSVSYKARYQKHILGNLVYNPSFEEGKIKQLDSLTQSLILVGWDVIGKNVVWIKSDSAVNTSKKNEVHSGTHSIKIHRDKANETDKEGEGVLSDYIKVIPGNYHFSLYVNLKNIKNPKSRLGTKIYDAIDIRLVYYDREKREISGDQYSQHYQTKVNTSFKGTSFSNYTEIDSTGWIHILGRSHIFPFPDGDLPDDTKFVRIFIGLKGTGTMWVDDIHYEYNSLNFTCLERLSPYFDTTFARSELIIPQPRTVEVLESDIYYRPFYKEKFPMILIPDNSDRITLLAAKRLETRLRKHLIELAGLDSTEIPALISNNIIDGPEKEIFVISVGRTSLFKKYSEKLPVDSIKDHDQGFFIHSLDNIPGTVFLRGTTPLANFYAVQAATQLFDNKRLLFHTANVIDYPEEEDRALLLTELDDYSLNFLNSTNQTRFSEAYLPADSDATLQFIRDRRSWAFSKWLYFSYEENDRLETDMALTKPKLIRYSQFIDGVAYLMDPSFIGGISIEKSLEQYYSDIQFSAYNEPDYKRIVNTSMYLNIETEILPFHSSNQEINKVSAYGCRSSEADLSNVCLLWSGYGLQTWQLDESDLLSFKNYYGQIPAFIDLTLYPCDREMSYFANDSVSPYKLLTGCLFDAYYNEVLPEVFKNVEKTIIAYNISNIFDRVRLQTASDFFWNPNNYNPDLSLYRALVSEFGTEAAKDIIKINDLYFKSKCELILAASYGSYNKHIRKVSAYMKELKELQGKLRNKNNTESLKELNNIVASLIREIEIHINRITGNVKME